MLVRIFANPDHICEICKCHYSIKIKTRSYTAFPGLIELKKHNAHSLCGVFLYELKRKNNMN